MGYKKILVAYDGSSAADSALLAAREFVEHGLAEKIIVLAVADPYKSDDATFEIAARMAGVVITSEAELHIDAIKKELGPKVEGFEDIVEIVGKLGKPQDEIIKVASESECGMIVMGSRGLGAIRGVLGSVSYAVLRDADVPVFVTK